MNIISFITSRLQGSQTTGQNPVIDSAPTLSSLLVRYEQESNQLLTNEQLLLSILLIRDQIKALIGKGEEIQEAEGKKLVTLDEKLRQYGRKHKIT